MRLTSIHNLLWIMALISASWIAAPAEASAVPAQSDIANRAANQPQQRQVIAAYAAESQSESKSFEPTTTPGPQAGISNSGQAEGRVETAGIFPDSASLLPIAALVGFSFLLGGIVCGTIKTRH